MQIKPSIIINTKRNTQPSTLVAVAIRMKTAFSDTCKRHLSTEPYGILRLMK